MILHNADFRFEAPKALAALALFHQWKLTLTTLTLAIVILTRSCNKQRTDDECLFMHVQVNDCPFKHEGNKEMHASDPWAKCPRNCENTCNYAPGKNPLS